MGIRMVVSDLDDTLLSKDLSISDYTKAVVKSAAEKGVAFVLASGRMYASMLPYHRRLELSTPIIACNGAEIIEVDGRRSLHERYISDETAREVAAYANSLGLYIQVYRGDEYFYNISGSKWYEHYEASSGVKGYYVSDIVSFIDQSAPKLLIIEDPENIPDLLADFQAKFSDKAEIAISKPMYIEVTHKEATKRNACEALAAMLGVSREEILCCGDSLNDLSMIKWAGVGVCVENARENIRAFADYVTASCNDDGVAKAIERFVL